MDTIDFLFCCNTLSCNPDDGQFPEEEAPVDLPAPEPPTSGPARAPVKAMGRRRDSRSKRPGAASARAHDPHWNTGSQKVRLADSLQCTRDRLRH